MRSLTHRRLFLIRPIIGRLLLLVLIGVIIIPFKVIANFIVLQQLPSLPLRFQFFDACRDKRRLIMLLLDLHQTLLMVEAHLLHA